MPNRQDIMEPFTQEQYANILVSGASTDFQLWTAPWASPGLKVGYIKNLAITNTVGAGMEVRIYDRDLASTTPTSRGSGSFGGALMVVGVAAAGTSGVGVTTVFDNTLPSEIFQAGVVVQCSQTNAHIMATMGVK